MTSGSTRRRFWCSPVFLLVNVWNLGINFHGFSILSFYNKIENHPTDYSKSYETKVWKQRNWDLQIFNLSRRLFWNVTFFWRLCLRVVNRCRNWSKLQKFVHKMKIYLFVSIFLRFPSQSVCTPHFWSGASGKWIYFMIAKWLLWSFWSPCKDL